jgi:predicted O-methyltransferase YrrM
MPDTADFIHRAEGFIRHFFRAKGADSIHSPFVFSFYQEVLAHPYAFNAFSRLEQAREELRQDRQILEYDDPGAVHIRVKRTVSGLSDSSLMPPEKAALLFRLVFWLKPKKIIELGTCLGLSTAYLAEASFAPVYSFEAVPAIALRAQKLWIDLGIDNIRLLQGRIEKTLPLFLKGPEGEAWDLAIVDANHRYLPTMENFHLLNESRKGRRACIVFDDIYWSREMKKAWLEIQAHPDVDVSLDLFHLGIIFFRPESSRENFKLRW